jgi:3-oxoacid CoA-transferase
MDLAVSGSRVIILMEHCDSKQRAKLVAQCSYPLTAPECVDVIVTDLAILERVNGKFTVTGIVKGFTKDEIQSLTPMNVEFSDNIRVI